MITILEARQQPPPEVTETAWKKSRCNIYSEWMQIIWYLEICFLLYASYDYVLIFFFLKMEMVLTISLNFLQVDALSSYASSLNNLADVDLTQTNLNIVVGDTPATASVFILFFLENPRQGCNEQYFAI